MEEGEGLSLTIAGWHTLTFLTKRKTGHQRTNLWCCRCLDSLQLHWEEVALPSFVYFFSNKRVTPFHIFTIHSETKIFLFIALHFFHLKPSHGFALGISLSTSFLVRLEDGTLGLTLSIHLIESTENVWKQETKHARRLDKLSVTVTFKQSNHNCYF